jgi:L-ascorbate metabolism protein UlaG (beta-lactamase superfamily)
MVITYFGKQFFKITLGDLVLALDPISKDSKEKSSRFGSDIVLSSLNHPDFNGTDQMSYGGKEPYVITGPGEYEIKGVFIKGFATTSSYGGKELSNTIYLIRLEDTNLLFLGALNNSDLPGNVKEELEEVDILFVPVAEAGVLTAPKASKLATQLEAKVIIPMTYEQNDLKLFLKEEGAQETKPIDKLVIKKKDLSEKDGQIIVLKSEN